MTATIKEIKTPAGRVAGIGIFPRGAAVTPLELYRIAYDGDGAELTGVQVIDEFETMSGPVLVSDVTSLGEVYDAALTMAFARSADLEIGSGWPPVCVGLDAGISVGLSSVRQASLEGVEAFATGGVLQEIIVVVTTVDVSATALRRLAASARSLLRSQKSLAVVISTAKPPAGGGRWSAYVDDLVRKAVAMALNPEDFPKTSP